MAEELTVAQKAVAWPTKVKEYLDDLKLEMRRVTWPPWKQVRATTGVVIAAVFVFSAYFFVVDTIVGRAVTKLFDSFAK
jgi:preprotein translocase subunit SecE